jgi:pyruvate dehydrogenase E2 component (dihydrolipoamide acetyltransferase)
MAIECKFPDVGEGIVEGEIRRWLVREGDRVKADQPLVEVETDKALVELPAPKAGTVLKIRVREGEIIKVGQVVAVIGEPGEIVAESPPPAAPHGSVTVVGSLDETPQEIFTPRHGETRAVTREGKARAIPSVRKLAQDLGVDLEQVKGSGIDGRILREDVLRTAEFQKTQSAAAQFSEAGDLVERVPMSRLRRTIAAAMVQSAFTAPHVTIHDEVEVSRLMELIKRERPRAEAKGGTPEAGREIKAARLTLLPFVIKAVIEGLKAEPFLNASLDMDAGMILLKKSYHIGIATETPEGLMVPVVRDADRKEIFDLALEVAALALRARNRTASLAELKGSSFTITNYGALGGSFGTPIINPPEVAILGMGRVQDKPVARDGKVVLRPMLPLSLSFDHRLIDGATAQRFLNSVMARLEAPDPLIPER